MISLLLLVLAFLSFSLKTRNAIIVAVCTSQLRLPNETISPEEKVLRALKYISWERGTHEGILLSVDQYNANEHLNTEIRFDSLHRAFFTKFL